MTSPRPATDSAVAEAPRLRGHLHQWAAVVVAVFSGPLVMQADAGRPRAAAAVFAGSMFVLFATSAAYHRVDWSARWSRRMKRADHIAIFVLIAGTYSSVAIAALDGWVRTAIVVGAWSIVAAGVVAAVLGLFEKRGAANTSYITFGWLALVMAPQLLDRLDPIALLLLVAGGVVYTVGAVFLALRRPNPWPRWFGYHEVWHANTLVAAMCHSGVVWILVT